jgi:hypothetical protein
LNEKNKNSNGFEILPVSETLRAVSLDKRFLVTRPSAVTLDGRVPKHAQEGAVSMIRELIDPIVLSIAE